MKNKKISELVSKIRSFRDDRDWKQYHNPKDLAEALSVEASELLELFMWKSQKDSYEVIKDSKKSERVQEELADVFLYAFEFLDILDLDLEEIIEKKMKKNALKYPVSKSKGSAEKYTEL